MEPAQPQPQSRPSPGGLRRLPVRRAYTAGMRIAGMVCSVVLATGVLAVAAGAPAACAANRFGAPSYTAAGSVTVAWQDG